MLFPIFGLRGRRGHGGAYAGLAEGHQLPTIAVGIELVARQSEAMQYENLAS
jgi:hypothetical protein